MVIQCAVRTPSRWPLRTRIDSPPDCGGRRALIDVPIPFGVESPGYVAVRVLQYLAFSLWTGSVGASLWWLRHSMQAGETAAGVSRATLVRMLRGALLLLVLSLVLRLWAQAHAFDDTTLWPQPVMVMTLLRKTLWGRAWLLEALALGVGAVAAWSLRRDGSNDGAWRTAAGVTLMLAFSFALSGHAASSPSLLPLAVLADTAHATAAGAWIGGLVVLAVAALPAARSTVGGARGLALSNAITAFSNVALAAVTTLVATGAFASWLHVGSLAQLWSAVYGRTLLIKLFVMTPMLLAGLANWRWIQPRLRTHLSADVALRWSLRIELGFAVAVLLVTAILVATPTPMEG